MNKRTIAKILEDIELLKAEILKYSVGECSSQQVTRIVERIQETIKPRKRKKLKISKNIMSSVELLIRIVIMILEQISN